MRIVSVALVALLTGAACSDSSGPDSSMFQPRTGTHDMVLTSCIGCDTTDADLAALWKGGVFARVDVTKVMGEGADGEFLALETLAGSTLFEPLEARTFTISRLTNGEYRGSVGFGDGSISIAFVRNGCAFSLFYPGVSTGAGSCVVQ